VWSSQVESSRKDVERTFGSLKKRWRCIINPIDLLDPCHIERLFITCCILHNMLVDHDGMDDWNNRIKKAVFNENDDIIYLSSVGTSSIIDDILYNGEDDTEPGPNHIIKLADIYSNVQTGQEMTHRLQNLIQHFVFAKENSQLYKLKNSATL
jgi:hypothetical protein